jgi:hypothetical protein
MATVLIRPATVPETFRINGLNTDRVAPSSTSTDIPTGAFVQLSSGLLQEAATSGNKIGSAVKMYGITNEPFKASLAAAGSVPIQQTDVSTTIALPGVVFEVNYYGDGSGGAGSTVTAGLLGTSVAIKRQANGVYVAVPWVSGDATFKVVGLVDPVGTVYGRILVAPDSANRVYA